MQHAAPVPRIADLPLWRLIVLLDDAERTIGPGSETARTIVRVLRERLREVGGRNEPPEAWHAD